MSQNKDNSDGVDILFIILGIAAIIAFFLVKWIAIAIIAIGAFIIGLIDSNNKKKSMISTNNEIIDLLKNNISKPDLTGYNKKKSDINQELDEENEFDDEDELEDNEKLDNKNQLSNLDKMTIITALNNKKKNEKIKEHEKKLKEYKDSGLFDEEIKEIEKGSSYDIGSFEEQELDEDDFYYEDDDNME